MKSQETTDLFVYTNYRKFLKARLTYLRQRKKGQSSLLARHLRTHPTLVSQVLRETRHLTQEQAFGVTQFLGLSPLETEYFIALVETERAGTAALQGYYRRKLDEIRSRSQTVSARLPTRHELSRADQAIFYTQWQYSAVRLLSSIEGFQTREAIAERLKFSPKKIREISEFLLETGLCQSKGSGFEMGPARTHLPAQSSLAVRHHTNWRLKGLENLEALSLEDELAFTAPMSIAKKDIPRVRRMLLEVIEQIGLLVKDSKAEELLCLNMDWFII